MELQHLKTFVAVAEAGSLTRAAETLHLSQPAVSAQVKSLEVELGLSLFRRAARGMELTAAGRELLASARDVVYRADGVCRLAQRLRDATPSTIRLGTIDCGYDLKLARVIGRLTQDHPELEVQLVAGNSGQHARAVIDHDLDAAFVEGDVVKDTRLFSWRIATSRVGVIGPTAWRDQLINADWPALAEFPWIFQSAWCSYCVLLNRLCEENHITLKPQIEAEAFGEVKQLVAGGLGLSIADLDDAADEVVAGRVFVWPGLTFDMPVWLIAPAALAEESAITAMAEAAQLVHPLNLRRSARTATPG